MCLASNCTQARVNLSLRPRLEDGKASLAIKYQELREIREACWEKQQRLETYLEKWNPQSALGQLQAKLDASEAESEVQIEQFLAQDLPLESFLESFCQSRTRSHICRTQLEKLQELLQKDQGQKDQGQKDQGQKDLAQKDQAQKDEVQKDQVGRDPVSPGAPVSPPPARLAPLRSGVAPKAFNLSYGFVPAFLIPSEAVVPFPVPAAPPKHHLPALGQQPESPCSETPSLGSPLRLVGHIPVLSPQLVRRQQRPRHQKQEPPHR
ncbi:VPS37D, ESCRT-I subunit [Willisornis vidua]|uniref:VPS37D, ESCRT-I subunit n=1 Tax=Willisornis vidua TaxID=1566151 RepID=A0ABQ9DJG3_9PASS|nr:VPS37D, ESCRT-I subunit [Willisornis vidua]